MAGQTTRAGRAYEAAATLFAQKGNIASLERVRTRLASANLTARPGQTSP
jgi:hypothetical protein